MMVRGLVYKRTVAPVIALLKQGISPEKISLGMACGIVLGVFSVLGATTILCGLAAVMFRLNLPATQLVNYMVCPLQLVLLVPYCIIEDLKSFQGKAPQEDDIPLFWLDFCRRRR